MLVNVGGEYNESLKLAQAMNIPVFRNETSPQDINWQTCVLHIDENTGYARGNNAGVRFLLEHYKNIDYLLFSNDDIFFQNNDVVEQCVAFLEHHIEFAAVASLILDDDRNISPPMEKPMFFLM